MPQIEERTAKKYLPLFYQKLVYLNFHFNLIGLKVDITSPRQIETIHFIVPPIKPTLWIVTVGQSQNELSLSTRFTMKDLHLHNLQPGSLDQSKDRVV